MHSFLESLKGIILAGVKLEVEKKHDPKLGLPSQGVSLTACKYVYVVWGEGEGDLKKDEDMFE